MDSFISRQSEMDSSFIKQLATELYEYEPPEVSVIVTGLDPTGPHIYIVSNGNLACNDSVGFASIGIGSGHANSQFMFAGHTPDTPYPETLLLTYSAKKRAEVAPGVGEATDMFFVGVSLGAFSWIGAAMLGVLDRIYLRVRKGTQRAVSRSRGEIREFFEQIIRAQAAKAKDQAALQDDQAPIDSEAIRNGSEETKQERKMLPPGEAK